MKYVFFFVPSFFSRDLRSNSIIFTRLFLVEGLSRSSHEFSLAYHQQESITVLAHQMSLRESFFFYFFLFITSRLEPFTFWCLLTRTFAFLSLTRNIAAILPCGSIIFRLDKELCETLCGTYYHCDRYLLFLSYY